MWWYGGYGWAGWLVMGGMMLVFWSLLIFGGIALWRAVTRADHGPRQTDERSAERLLDERFARGELDIEEYTRRRDLLRTGH